MVSDGDVSTDAKHCVCAPSCCIIIINGDTFMTRRLLQPSNTMEPPWRIVTFCLLRQIMYLVSCDQHSAQLGHNTLELQIHSHKVLLYFNILSAIDLPSTSDLDP